MDPKIYERYKHKMKTAEELSEILGQPPRDFKVIMCHGVFDLVHPGHIRHLLFAKSKADILVASLTADVHIDKGKFRPHVPQNLRAVNIAAFDFVDFVVIDKNPKPIENLSVIKPDFFAKGYEYVAGGMPPKTAEEADVVGSYGGEIVFTPGDIVYSSSALINAAAPNVGMEKLLTLMESESITFADLRNTLEAMEGKKVHIIGDTIVDSYTECAMVGGQTKTPTMSVLYQDKKDYVGGAGIVAAHLRSAGADVVFSTVIGDDQYKDFVIDDLKEQGVDIRPVIDQTRPTTNKNAIVAAGYRLLKIDTLENASISDSVLETLTDAIKTVECDALIYSDFRHGIFNKRTISSFLDAVPDNVFKVADSQVASRWGNICDFVNFDLITPNEREARFSLADQDSGVRPLASALYDGAKCKLLIMKLGPRGVLACRSSDHEALDSFFVVDSFVDHVVDAVGAGDALLAYATLSKLAHPSVVIATILGCMAAACEVERDGNIPIERKHVLEKINQTERQAIYAAADNVQNN